MGAQQAGCDVGGHQCPLHQQGAGTAHRIDQGAAVCGDFRPAGAQQHRRGQVFLQRRDAGVATVAALVQRTAGQIQRNLCHRSAHQHVHAQIGCVGVDVRALAADLAQPIHDRILHALLGELGVAQAVIHAVGIDGDRAVRGDVLLPCHRMDGFIQAVGADLLDLQQRHQHATGESRPQAGAVRRCEFALEMHAGDRLLDPGATECGELGRKQFFQALRAGGKELHQRGNRSRKCPNHVADSTTWSVSRWASFTRWRVARRDSA